MPKLTKGVITRDEAVAMCPDYVSFVEKHADVEAIIEPFMWNYDKKDRHGYPTTGIKVGQAVITCWEGQFVRAKVTSLKQPGHEGDGPVVRVSNGEYSWRVDGDKYAFIIPKQPKETAKV